MAILYFQTDEYTLYYRDYPEFCVTAKMRCKIELIFQGGSGVGCARLVYNITPTGGGSQGAPSSIGASSAI